MSSPGEKAAVFSEWTISKGDGLESRPEIWKNEDPEMMIDDDLHPAEREFRRKSRAFAKAAAQKRVDEDRRKEQKKKTERRLKSGDLEPEILRPKPSTRPSSSASSPVGRTANTSQLFDSLSFYYIPNAELGPRKLRIAKARQHGAQWVQQITKATHVIVDKKLSWEDIQVVLRDVDRPTDESWPFVLVNEEYPLDCISYRRILNPEQRRYFIRGSPEFQSFQGTKTKSEPLPRNPSKTRRLENRTIKPDRHRRRLTTPP